MAKTIRIGTAAWAIPRGEAGHFPTEGSGLLRYSAVFNSAEINSTFTKVHKPATFARWAEIVPDDFRFSVKMPKAISHELKLQDANDAVARFVDSVQPLGNRMGPWLLQLPPSLACDAAVATTFFGHLRKQYAGAVVFEPRHASWFTDDVEAMLRDFAISRVAADPAKVAVAAKPGGASSLAYYRLHGSPRVYYASYEPAWLAALADTVRQCRADDIWIIFDNTASGAAAANARALQALCAADGTGNPL
jgi:uncharacterized protein YecE (DUF72 family)